jgi:hypothetical protein
MKNKGILTVLVGCISILSGIAASLGIWSGGGPGNYQYNSIRGREITIYGKGLYQHMSAEVAPQGIAQDYITLFAAIPLLLISLHFARKGSLKGRFLLAGTLGYFLVTYLFYLVMGMYNYMFLAYVALLGSSFFAFVITMSSLKEENLQAAFEPSTPVKAIGGFLIFNAVCIALLWLSIVVPPLLDGTIIPREVEHYTTLIVQGLDLGLLLPAAFISGWLLMRKSSSGYLYAPVYFGFLSLLMAALMAKIAAMAMLGFNIIPAVFIIPLFFLGSLLCNITLFRNINSSSLIKT